MSVSVCVQARSLVFPLCSILTLFLLLPPTCSLPLLLAHSRTPVPRERELLDGSGEEVESGGVRCFALEGHTIVTVIPDTLCEGRRLVVAATIVVICLDAWRRLLETRA